MSELKYPLAVGAWVIGVLSILVAGAAMADQETFNFQLGLGFGLVYQAAAYWITTWRGK